MRDFGLVAAGMVFGWLTSKTWERPRWQLGLVVFLVATALMILGFALAVVGHGRHPGAGDPDEEDNGDDGARTRQASSDESSIRPVAAYTWATRRGKCGHGPRTHAIRCAQYEPHQH